MVEGLKQIKLLGEGAFGKCYLCEKPDDKSKWVVKQIDISRMSPQEKKEAYHEAKVMSAFDHPNIIKFRDVYTTTNGKLNIVMDYADGGDLASKIQAQRGRLFPENQILNWFVQICLAMKHVHDRKVLHRDIKGQNIFLMSNGMIKLGDFGIAKVLSHTIDKARTQVGTPYYLSPEIIQNKPYSFKSDIWSLGVLLYELCALRPPFDGNSIHQLSLNIVKGNYSPIANQYSRDLKNLIGQMLSIDPGRRPSLAQILRMNFIKEKIQNFLGETIRAQEFSHTVLHNQNVFSAQDKKKGEELIQKKNEEVKRRNEEMKKKREEEQKREEENRRKKEEEIRELEEAKKRAQARENFKEHSNEESKDPYRRDIPPARDGMRNLPPKGVPPKERKPQVADLIQKIPEYKPKPKAPNPNPNPWYIEPKKENPEPAYQALYDKPISHEAPQIPKSKPASQPPTPQAKFPIAKHLEDELKPKKDFNLSVQSEKQRAKEKDKAQKRLEELRKQKEKLLKDSYLKEQEDLKKKKEASKEKDERKQKQDEERRKMIDEMKRKKKAEMKNKKDEAIVQWVGDERDYAQIEREQEKLIIKLQEAIIEGEKSEEIESEVSESTAPTAEVSEGEDIVDRVDELENQEILPYEPPQILPVSDPENTYDKSVKIIQNFFQEKVSEPCSEYQSSRYGQLETLRLYLEEKLGHEKLLKAYEIVKDLWDKEEREWSYDECKKELIGVLDEEIINEYLYLIHSMIIVESRAEEGD
ncbi:unnamed protein product [Blepharisma stoltei]|uniref:non-specific serine/threonine protein kinase n=1 Tax=Blepharisma stoltei TaxID=1481888 RepID=A0AAU9KA69_9CILI|nr:unnamed protein product [Blepharisma stoltei]